MGEPPSLLSAIIGCEAAMTQGPSRDHTEQCRARIVKAMSSDVAVSVRVRDAHERMSRQPSDAELDMKKVRFAEQTTENVPPGVSTSHTLPTPVAHGGSSSSSAPSQKTPTVEHVRLDDSDENTVSKKLQLSKPRDLPSNAPMSADVNLSSGDVRVECVLERYKLERVANTSSDPVLSRIAGEVSDEQFLEVAGLDGPARNRVAHDLLKLGTEFERHSRCGDRQPTQDSFHVKSHGRDTGDHLRHARQLLGPECSDERRTSVRVLANRTTRAPGLIANMQGVHGLAVEGPTKPKVPANT